MNEFRSLHHHNTISVRDDISAIRYLGNLVKVCYKVICKLRYLLSNEIFTYKLIETLSIQYICNMINSNQYTYKAKTKKMSDVIPKICLIRENLRNLTF